MLLLDVGMVAQVHSSVNNCIGCKWLCSSQVHQNGELLEIVRAIQGFENF